MRPVVTAAEAYPELERAAVAAEREILFSFRVFDCETRLRTAEARKAAGGDDWAALLAALAARGVRVRLQVSDFDPIGGAALHEAAWRSLRRLAAAARARPGAGARIEAFPALHPAEVGSALRLLFAPKARRELRKALERRDDDAPPLAKAAPGLKNAMRRKTPRLHPASHHQKIAIVDRRWAMIGGMDVDERRWDTPDHDRPAAETWRDVSLIVEGPRAAAVHAAAAGLWNRAAADWRASPLLTDAPKGLARPRKIEAKPPREDPAFRIVMTESAAEPGAFRFGPQPVRTGTEEAALELIGEAERFLYIETQFLRSDRIARALAAAGRRRKALELVIVLPFAPEHFAFEGRRDAAVRQGEALQSRALGLIRRAFGSRLAVLSPAKPRRRGPEDSFVAHGAGIVYVHSKVLIADGKAAMVGSANLNDRSLRWDTEASALWREAPPVAALLDRLAESWLGPAPGPADRVATWREAAEANRAAPPDLRQGFLLPHDERRARRFAKRYLFLPDELF